MMTRLLAAIAATAALLLLPLSASAATEPDTPQYLPPCTSGDVTFSMSAQVGDPSVSVNPTRGPSGSQATLALRNFTPGEAVTATFRVTGDPVVATGTVGADGRAILTFTVPQAPNGTYWILVAQANRTCIHAAVHFTIGPVTPTPVPTATPPRPTPTIAATVAPPTATVVAPTPTRAATPVPPTPVPPSAGSGGAGTPGAFNADVITLGLLFISVASLLVGMANRRRLRRIYVVAPAEHGPILPRQKTHPADPDGPSHEVGPRMHGQR